MSSAAHADFCIYMCNLFVYPVSVTSGLPIQTVIFLAGDICGWLKIRAYANILITPEEIQKDLNHNHSWTLAPCKGGESNKVRGESKTDNVQKRSTVHRCPADSIQWDFLGALCRQTMHSTWWRKKRIGYAFYINMSLNLKPYCILH